MFKAFCLLLGVSVAIGFIMLVGTAHYIETIIALCLGAAAGFGFYFKFRK